MAEGERLRQLRCNRCGGVVSSAVPETTVVRAWIECPECIARETTEDDGVLLVTRNPDGTRSISTSPTLLRQLGKNLQ